MKINRTELKKLLSFSMLVKFSLTPFLNKGRVQRIFATGRILFQTSGAKDEITDLKNFCFLFGSHKFFFGESLWILMHNALKLGSKYFRVWMIQ